MIDELSKELMLGSAKLSRELLGIPEELEEFLAPDPEESHEHRALQLVAVLTAYEQAGLKPTETEGLAGSQSEEDELPACSGIAAEVLNRIISTENDSLLKEWVALATNKKRRVPHRCLVGLLTGAKKLDDLRPQVFEVIDNRGRWLAKLNSDWNYVFRGMPSDVDALDESIWLEGSFEERLQYLRTLRRADSGRVLHLLKDGLAGENAKTRTAFIRVLDEGLSKDDHDFLESMLDDRSIELRRTVARMLCKIPGSDLSKRMAERLRPLVKVVSKRLLGRKTLRIEPPEELDDAMKRDGLSEKTSSGMGRRAWLLFQICAHTPLAWWEKNFPFLVSDWMDRAMKNDWKISLFSGWITAAIEEENQAWLLELLKRKLPKQLADLSRGLAGALSAENKLHWYTTRIEKGAFLTVYDDIIKANREKSVLDEKLSRAILTHLRRYLGAKNTHAGFELRNSLPKLALILSPEVLSEALDNWPTTSPSFEYYAEHAAEFFERIKLRQQMYEEFE